MMESRWRADCCELLEIEQEKQEAALTLASPNSHCPNCKAAIRPWQNVPVLSYLVLGGKCAQCGMRISPRYPLIELASGLMIMALGYHFAPSTALVGAMLFTWCLITLTMIVVVAMGWMSMLNASLLAAGAMLLLVALVLGRGSSFRIERRVLAKLAEIITSLPQIDIDKITELITSGVAKAAKNR